MTLYINRHAIDGTPLESFGRDHFGFRVRCALPGWLQKMQFGVAAKSASDARRAASRYNGHHGQRMMVYRPGRNLLQGYTRQIEPDGRFIHYECNGTWGRFDDDYHTDPIPPDDTITTVFQGICGSVTPVYVDAANFATNSTEVGEFGTDDIEVGPGIRPGQAIKTLLQMSNSGFEQFDFATLTRALGLNGAAQVDAAHYTVRDPTPGRPDFILNLSDLTSRKVTSDIYDLVTDVQIKPGKVAGTHDAGSHPYLTDSTTNFLDLGVTTDGCYALNKTKTESLGSNVFGWVAAITNNGHTLGALTGYPWENGDEYVVVSIYHTLTPATASGDVHFWEVKGTPIEAPELTYAQAAHLAESIIARLSVPVVNIPFTVGRDTIRDFNGAPRSVWELLHRPVVVAIENDSNLIAKGSYSVPDMEAFYMVALDADYEQRVVTLTMGEDHRLDAVLQRAGVTAGQAIQPEPRGAAGSGSEPPRGPIRGIDGFWKAPWNDSRYLDWLAEHVA